MPQKHENEKKLNELTCNILNKKQANAKAFFEGVKKEMAKRYAGSKICMKKGVGLAKPLQQELKTRPQQSPKGRWYRQGQVYSQDLRKLRRQFESLSEEQRVNKWRELKRKGSKIKKALVDKGLLFASSEYPLKKLPERMKKMKNELLDTFAGVREQMEALFPLLPKKLEAEEKKVFARQITRGLSKITSHNKPNNG